MFQMIAQIIIGCLLIVRGIYTVKGNSRVTEHMQSCVGAEHLAAYCLKTGTITIVAGMIVIIMSQIEFWLTLSTGKFLFLYGIAILPFIALLLVYNKKYAGRFFVY